MGKTHLQRCHVLFGFIQHPRNFTDLTAHAGAYNNASGLSICNIGGHKDHVSLIGDIDFLIIYKGRILFHRFTFSSQCTFLHLQIDG